MYETFYGLRERPFSLLPDPDYLYLSPKHLRALTLLEYGMMNQAGFSVICGDTGAGKTTLIRRLLTELGEDTTVGLITNTHKSFGELLSWVLMAFGIDGENRSKAQMHQLLIEFLIDQYARNHRTVLIVDEAQNMTADTLEELRMLSNINADKDQVLQVILAGQPALRETLRKPELMQFAQRIAVDYYLESLNRDETREYIQHRLDVAGGNPETFTEAACHAVFRYSGGTPRLINLLCDTALVYGFAEQTRVIDAPLIEDVVREQHRNSIVPTFNKPGYETGSQPQQKTGHETATTSAAAKTETQKTAPVAETPAMRIIEEQAIRQEQEMASIAQKAASDYESKLRVGHAESHAKPQGNESSGVVAAAEPVSHVEDSAVSSKVTPIKHTASKKPHAADHAETESRTGTKNQAAGNHEAANTNDNGEFAAEAGAMHQSAAHKPESRETDTLDDEDSVKKPAYKDLYPIVHIADEPRKNINVLILGFAGGVLLMAIVMVIMMWMMLRNDVPAQAAIPATPLPPPVEVSPAPASSAGQEQLEAIQKERDEAMAAAEALKRERDAAMIAAQKQEAMRAAEKRANEIIAEQERKYANEMALVRQRAFDAEIAAAKARERERIASEEAERARLEAASRSTPPAPAPQPVVTVAPQPVQTATPGANVEPEPTATTKTKNAAPAADANTQFSANPCNSPSAKFLSTCKK